MILTKSADAIGEGERLQLSQERRAKTIKGVLFGIGLICGACIGFYIAANDFDVSAPWPPVLSAGLAILYVIALLGGSALMEKVIDEEERFRTYRAAAFAGSVYLVVYPVWFLLWKGGFTIEPIHWALFVLFWFSLLSAALSYRFR